MNKNLKSSTILKIFLFVILLLVLVSILKTSGYISAKNMPKNWRTHPEFLKPQGVFTEYDKSILIKLTDNQMKAIYTVILENFYIKILTVENILLFTHNLAQSDGLKELANKLVKARTKKQALTVFDDYNKIYKLI